MNKLNKFIIILPVLAWQCWAVQPSASFTIKGRVFVSNFPGQERITLQDTLTKQFVDSAIGNANDSFSMTFTETPRSVTTWILAGTREPDCEIPDTPISVPMDSLKGGSGSYLGADTVNINPIARCRLLSRNPAANTCQAMAMKVWQVSSGTIETEYMLAASGPVRMALYGINGRLVKTFLDKCESGGKHVASLGISGLPAGVYFLKLQTDTHAALVKMSIE
jgi:hypothetical protein